MGVTIVVVVVAAVAGLIGFSLSAARAVALDPSGTIQRHPRLRRFLRERFDRDTRRGFLTTLAFGVLFAGAVVLGGLLDMVDTGSGLAELDDELAEWGSLHASSAAVDVLKVVTELGSTYLVVVALAVTGVIAYHRRRQLEILVFLATVGIGQNLLNNGIKMIVDRERPSVLQLVGSHGSSFPSGHSAAAAACWAADRVRARPRQPAPRAGGLRRRRRAHRGGRGDEPGAARRALADRHRRRPRRRVGLVRPGAAGVQDAGAHSVSAPGRTLNVIRFVVPLQPPSSS